MADIDVVKKRSNVWLWVVVLIVAALLLWALLAAFSGGTAEPVVLLQDAPARMAQAVSALA
jgi:hypothetical protein